MAAAQVLPLLLQDYTVVSFYLLSCMEWFTQ